MSKAKLTKDDINRLNAGTIINLRRAVADYMRASRLLPLPRRLQCCPCCAERRDAETRLASLLDMPQAKDGSYEWEKFRTPR